MKQFTKKQIIAVAAGVVLIAVMMSVGVLEKLGRLGVVSQLIAVNMMHPTHGDARPLEKITTAYIKANTGTTKIIDYQYLPEALKPLKKYTHIPFEMGACVICHQPNRSKPAAIVTHTVEGLCYKCHQPIGGIRESGKAIDCNKCHSPHHADREKLLRNDIIETVCPAGRFNTELTTTNMKTQGH